MTQLIFANDGGFLVRSNSGNYTYSYPTSPNTMAARRDAPKVAQEMAVKVDEFAKTYRDRSFTFMAQQQHFAECWDAAEARMLRVKP